jgi:hypothetical protein
MKNYWGVEDSSTIIDLFSRRRFVVSFMPRWLYPIFIGGWMGSIATLDAVE